MIKPLTFKMLSYLDAQILTLKSLMPVYLLSIAPFQLSYSILRQACIFVYLRLFPATPSTELERAEDVE